MNPSPESTPLAVMGPTIYGGMFAYLVLPLIHIVLIRRITSLVRHLQQVSTDEGFWRTHVSRMVPRRHETPIIEQLVWERPWRSYALIHSPKRATRVFNLVEPTRYKKLNFGITGGTATGGLGSVGHRPVLKESPQPNFTVQEVEFEWHGLDVIDYEFKEGIEYFHYSDGTLSLQRREVGINAVGGYSIGSKSVAQYHSIALALLPQADTLLTVDTSGELFLNGRRVNLPHPSTIIDISYNHPYILLLLADGTALHSPLTIKDDKQYHIQLIVMDSPIIRAQQALTYRKNRLVSLLTADGRVRIVELIPNDMPVRTPLPRVAPATFTLLREIVVDTREVSDHYDRVRSPIVDISVVNPLQSENGLLVLTEDGDCHGAGNNKLNVLGSEELPAPAELPNVVQLKFRDVTSITTCLKNTLLVTADGGLHLTGVLTSDHDRDRNGNRERYTRPRRVPCSGVLFARTTQNNFATLFGQ